MTANPSFLVSVLYENEQKAFSLAASGDMPLDSAGALPCTLVIGWLMLHACHDPPSWQILDPPLMVL